MKKILLTIGGLTGMLVMNAQTTLMENFDYPPSGDTLTANGWTVTQASTTNPIRANGSGLSFTGYPANTNNIGASASLVSTGQDIYKAGSVAITTANAYASLLINVSNAQATGDYFFTLLPNNSPTNFTGRVYIKSSGAGYVVGLTKSNETPVIYGTTVFSFNVTYTMVLKYIYSSTTNTDDQFALFMFSSSIPATEPSTPEAGPTVGTQNDPANISRVVLRQGSAANAATLTVDGIRLGYSWADVPLPVKYKMFSANNTPSGNVIKWTTASEAGNSHFVVQRSINGGRYETIGTVKGAGNSSSNKNYAFTDADKNSGSICYRLKQVDFDGKSELSKISCVSIENPAMSDDMFTTPNPFNRDLNVVYSTQSTEQSANVQLIDMLGKVHYNADHRINKGSNNFDINTEALPLGIYFIRITTGNQVKTQRIIKK